MSLRECFDRYGCDKGEWHRYERVYEPIFGPVRKQPITLLEIGILRGASISAWLDYFPNATICGVDTFHRVPPERVPILTHPRVRWWRCDSTVEVPADLPLADFIIDDGYHVADWQRKTLVNYRPMLKPGGRYFIEDVTDLKIPGAIVHTTTTRAGSCILEIRG